MQAIEIITTESGGQLQLTERKKPTPSQNQVLIEVYAAGVNRPDIMQRQGIYPPPPGASDIPGLEVAGVIVDVGDKVGRWRIGDKVCALVTGGGYAHYCLANEELCLPVPKGLDFIQAAAIPETFFTVWNNVFDRGRLQSGETLLVHGGSSGIGTVAIQLAVNFGATVYVTAGTEKKCQFCQQLGAAAAINYRQQDFVEQIKRLTDNQGVNMILDMIAGPYFPRNLKVLAEEGRLLQIAIQQGAKSEINLWTVMMKRLLITGSTLRGRNDEFKATIARQLEEKVWPLIESGKINPVVYQVLPLPEAGEAHRIMERSEHIGKIVLQIKNG
jgi:putative PIG3 family NAD(P)H quinone oxidoreductase